MLKLTLADTANRGDATYISQTEGPIWVNALLITHVIPHEFGSYLHFEHHGHFVKESAEEVARMVDEERIHGLLRAGKAWTPPEGTPVPDNPYGVRVVPLGTGLDGKSLGSVTLEANQ